MTRLFALELKTLDPVMGRRYKFQIKRTQSSSYEIVDITAATEDEALAQLPQCVTWDFYHGENNVT